MGRFAVCRVLTAAVLALPLLGAPSTTARADPGGPPASALPAAATPTASLTLTSVSPTIVRPQDQLVVAGNLHNEGTTALDRPVVRVVLGPADTRMDRAGVQAWATQTGAAPGTEVARVRLKTSVAPGESQPFQVTVKGLATKGAATYGALPLSVEAAGAALRTFAGYQRVKQYQPMALAWAVPLTLDPDPNLFGAAGPARETAWASALGEGSRVSRVLAATRDAAVTWAVDPTLTPSLLKDAHSDGTGEQEQSLRKATQDQIQSMAAQHGPWVLPDTDADLAAVAASAQGEGLMQSLVARAAPVADALGGRADIAWPAGGAYTAAGESGLRRMFRVPALAAQVTAASTLDNGLGGTTPGAAQRSQGGLALLTYDDSLSRLLSRTTSPAEGVLSAQQFLAESVSLLNELPGTSGRSVLVTAPRSFNPDPATARAFFATAAAIPWLATTTTDAELAQARRAVASPAAPVTRPLPGGSPVHPPVLDPSRLRGLEDTLQTVEGVAQIRDDGNQFARTWTRAAEQLASTRWRNAPTAWQTLNGSVSKAADETTSAVKVAAGNINFLADSGRLQITVTNALEVPVENVKLTVEAANPRLRIDSPPSILHIGPKSRATVSLRVTALAAGLVPLRTILTTPDGTVVGQGANVQVRVTPTGDWIYWGLGGIAGAILLLGIWRSVRRRPRETAEPTPATAERTA
jgi:Family of unknown function (DUF6049)